MKYKFFTLTIFLLSFLIVSAQKDFREGYIITKENDTIKGLIDYRGDIRNAEKCVFIKDENTNPTTFYPTDIAAFRFTDDKMYISKLLITNNEILATKRVFLEYLVKGTMNLYCLRDKNNVEYFYAEKDNTGVQALIEEKKEAYKDDRLVLITNKKYFGVLLLMISNCTKLEPDLAELNLDRKSLIKFAVKYNECVCSDCEIYVKKRRKIAIKKGIILGGNLSFINLEIPLTNAESNFSISPSVLVGISIKFVIPNFGNKFSLQTEILFARHYYSSFTKTPNYATNISILTYLLEYPIMLQYTFPKRNFRPFFNIGFNNVFALKTKYHFIQTKFINNKEIYIINYNLLFRKYQPILFAGLGFQYDISDKVSLLFGFRYESGLSVFGESIKNYSLLTSITF